MNKNSFIFGIIGLFIGLFIGFYAANNLNRNAGLQTQITENPALPQVNNMVVRDQHTTGGAIMPEITETLDKAQYEPNNFQAQIDAGDLYLKIQNFTKAIEFYKAANKIKPEDYETITRIGNAYFDSEQYEAAESWYVRALEIKPDDIAVRTDYGSTFLERNDPARAIQEFQTSLKTDPKHEATLYNLGVAFLKTGETEEAKKIADKIEQLNPQSPLAKRLREFLQ